MRSEIMDNSHNFVKSDTLRVGITDCCSFVLYVRSLNVSSSSYSSKKLRDALKFNWRSNGGLPWRRHWILSIAKRVQHISLDFKIGRTYCRHPIGRASELQVLLRRSFRRCSGQVHETSCPAWRCTCCSYPLPYLVTC